MKDKICPPQIHFNLQNENSLSEKDRIPGLKHVHYAEVPVLLCKHALPGVNWLLEHP